MIWHATSGFNSRFASLLGHDPLEHLLCMLTHGWLYIRQTQCLQRTVRRLQVFAIDLNLGESKAVRLVLGLQLDRPTQMSFGFPSVFFLHQFEKS
jgi:hypothetical protein